MFFEDFPRRLLEKIEKCPPAQLRDYLKIISRERIFFKKVLESMIEGILITDLDNSILYCNHYAARIFGLQEKSAVGSNYFSAVQNEQLKHIYSLAVREFEPVRNAEYQLKEPAAISVNVNIHPIVDDSTGKIIGHIFMLLDITEKKNRMQKQRQMESLASLASLTAGVAHEIKNPLASITLHIELLERQIRKSGFPGSEKSAELLNVISGEILRLDSIVNDFLFSVRPLKPEFTEENINDLITETLQFMHLEFEEQGIRAVFRPDPQTPVFPVDKRYFRQALLNIFKNSLQAINEAGRAGLVEVKTAYKEKKIIISVCDNGIGMNESMIDKVFDPYFTTKKSGTGLGLTIVHKIIREHNGEIHISSDSSGGTEIIIELLPQKEPLLITAEPETAGRIPHAAGN
ncbi:MAG: hypothetical protein A2096_03935 [Spirochaetes bacterium GWF1_41_5]|nr:MAG: hypothetical protein A2096_03935 [Spirochaetes bacterium GWF1_41_5]HBE03843.1 hypothetical protein [Spirochaetia bacterium]